MTINDPITQMIAWSQMLFIIIGVNMVLIILGLVFILWLEKLIKQKKKVNNDRYKVTN